jgi:predicted aspartyl protease
LARVTLRSPESGETVSGVLMLVDTGADVTLIPSSSVLRLGATVSGEHELSGFDGNKSMAQAARLHMEFLGKIFKGDFLLVDQEWGLLGRDVLNHLSLLFDGPGLSWGEQR